MFYYANVTQGDEILLLCEYDSCFDRSITKNHRQVSDELQLGNSLNEQTHVHSLCRMPCTLPIFGSV